MEKKIINYVTSLVLIILFLLVGTLGVLIFPGFLKFFGVNINSLPKVQIIKVHNWFGILLIILLIVHTKLNWKWIIGMSKQFIDRNKVNKKNSLKKTHDYIISIFLLIIYGLSISTGIIKFPGFLPFIGINLLNVPINEISLVHDWSGITAVFLSIIHLILNFNWLKSATKSFILLVKPK